jgi:hypothetical protein
MKRYAGFSKKFQGLGLMISTDHPMTYHEYILIEMRILWFKVLDYMETII